MRNFNWNGDHEWNKINKMDCLKWFILGGKENYKMKSSLPRNYSQKEVG